MSASIKEIKEKQNTLSDQDGSILKKWIRRLAEKLKDANNEIERIKFERKQEQINFQYTGYFIKNGIPFKKKMGFYITKILILIFKIKIVNIKIIIEN